MLYFISSVSIKELLEGLICKCDSLSFMWDQPTRLYREQMFPNRFVEQTEVQNIMPSSPSSMNFL